MAMVSGGELEVISGAGHMAAVEKPAEVAAALAEFVRGMAE
jgi:pimeloyl-ACP methyl ester carboxylesterase